MDDDNIAIIFALLFCFIGGLLIFAVISECGNQKQLEICYKQEPRTKDCEFLLWKYENREKTSTVAVPVFIHH